MTNDSNFATTSDLPTKVSDLTNDAGYITGYTETDPTVPSWAKQSTKPTYTASEVGALPSSTVIPSKTSDLTNDSNFITAAGAPVQSVNGQTGTVNISIPNATSDLTNDSGFITSSDIPTDVSSFNNDAGYITGYTETDPTVPSWAKASTKPTYTASEVGALPSTTVIPTNTNQLTNGAGFITSSALTSYLPLSAGSGKALTGDLYLGSHDIHRTPRTYHATQTSSKSLSSGNTKICGITNIAAGVYMISAYMHMAMSGGGNAYVNLYKATNSSSPIIFDNKYVKAGSTYFVTTTWVTYGSTGALSLYIEVTTSCTVDNVVLDMVSIA